MNTRIGTGTAIGLVVLLLAACGGDYYQITDPASGRTYFTRDIDHDDGHVRFTDSVTGDKVDLGSSEVKEISKRQYKDAVGNR